MKWNHAIQIHVEITEDVNPMEIWIGADATGTMLAGE